LRRYNRHARPVRAFGVEADVTGSTKSSEGLDARRRRLLFRSWHRGIREMDLIMGRFADAWIERLSEAELDQYERLIEIADPELYAWIAGQDAVPPEHDCELLRRLRAFHFAAGDTT
jgi:antitoxin CptB